jgi:hypothetical protein
MKTLLALLLTAFVANASEITYTDTTGVIEPNYQRVLKVHKFDPSLGTLMHVTLRIDGWITVHTHGETAVLSGGINIDQIPDLNDGSPWEFDQGPSIWNQTSGFQDNLSTENQDPDFNDGFVGRGELRYRVRSTLDLESGFLLRHFHAEGETIVTVTYTYTPAPHGRCR